MIERLTNSSRPGSRVVRDEVVNVAVVLLVVVAFFIEGAESTDSISAVAIGGVVIGGLALLARRRHPVPVMGVVIAAHIAVLATTESDLVMLPIVAVALYTVARHGNRREGVAIALCAALALAIVSAAFGDDGFVVELLETGAQAFLPIAIGDAMRTREDRVADLVEAEAEARVQAERLRIARDLHDVVAHGLSAIAIQSGVAARLLPDDQTDAREALEAINATGRSSLQDLRTMVGALRSTDFEESHPTPTDPNDLDDVVAPTRRAGVEVAIERHGRFPDDVSDALVVAVHRIIQEALMNVARHAGAVRADLHLDHRPTEVVITISNGPSVGDRPSIPSTGVGIIGMRERAESVGGVLDARPQPAGGFVVEATLPYSTARS